MPTPIVAPPAPPAGDLHYKCDQCGAELRFAPGQSVLKCDHCGHVQQIPGAANASPTAYRRA